jgi:hypothetical protein
MFYLQKWLSITAWDSEMNSVSFQTPHVCCAHNRFHVLFNSAVPSAVDLCRFKCDGKMILYGDKNYLQYVCIQEQFI